MLHFAGFQRKINKPESAFIAGLPPQSTTIIHSTVTPPYSFLAIKYYHKSTDTKSDIIFGQTTYPHGFHYEATKPHMAQISNTNYQEYRFIGEALNLGIFFTMHLQQISKAPTFQAGSFHLCTLESSLNQFISTEMTVVALEGVWRGIDGLCHNGVTG